MPNIKSSIKRVNVAAKKAAHNNAVKSSLKTSIKKFKEAVTSGDIESIDVKYNNAVKKIDQAAVKGIIHKNTAARKKSSLAKIKNTLTDKK